LKIKAIYFSVYFLSVCDKKKLSFLIFRNSKIKLLRFAIYLNYFALVFSAFSFHTEIPNIDCIELLRENQYNLTKITNANVRVKMSTCNISVPFRFWPAFFLASP